MTGSALVIGIGNDFRTDDGVGLAVAAEVARRGMPDVEVISALSDPGQILDSWTDVPLVVVVDAASGPDVVAGRIRYWIPGDDHQPTAVSSHSLGLPEIYALGQALGRVPRRLVVLTVEIEDSSHGVGLSPAVADAVPTAVEAVLAEVGRQP
ncbi:hydrogenase maturation protease [Mycolicibacterium aichiense]|uniref:Peptidase M52 n=1 Tax=Mycolicibacterium aichiense TaxID=1799 RepID=A0AAD1HKZ4_9MYCO|nr:hydrogenase maturation protease [Mycolicibacterium aichiense]MCV7018575.1 hydrogenase maturation protease [Mycolicibacterium aichiense]BBX07332.1 peptidase M52 [Mycolicibacterium aichiense]STZ81146.1 hydrogenase maturation protease [Mycolicibacterium aichiense]